MGKLKKKFSMFNYTKKWTSVILVFCLIWISASYILAAFDRNEIAETLGGAVIDLTKAIFCTYIVRAFFDTYCEKNYYLKMYRECHQRFSENGGDALSGMKNDDGTEREETQS